MDASDESVPQYSRSESQPIRPEAITAPVAHHGPASPNTKIQSGGREDREGVGALHAETVAPNPFRGGEEDRRASPLDAVSGVKSCWAPTRSEEGATEIVESEIREGPERSARARCA